jgi:hypothetical protein
MADQKSPRQHGTRGFITRFINAACSDPLESSHPLHALLSARFPYFEKIK